jgi:RNase P/RNase MRP subunit p29
MITTKRNARFSVPAAIIFCLFFAVGVSAQVQTGATGTSGQPAVETQVERGEIVTVNGNDLVVKMEDGSLRHFANVPESAKVTVEGKELGIHDLKPGMKLERTITTTTTPQTITTTQTVTGTVFHVNAPNSVTLRLEDGTTQQFKIPKGQKFTVDGQETDAFGLRKGMKISATKIVEEPQTVVEQQKQVTGSMPPPPTPPAADQPILVATAQAPAPPETAKTEEPEKLPNTATPIPLLGFLGLLSLLSGMGLWAGRMFRRV